MTTSSIVTHTGASELASPVDATALAQHARELADAAVAPNTARSYATYWRRFEAFCAKIGATTTLPAPKAAVLAFLASLSKEGRKTSTISVAFAAIRRAHDRAGVECVCDDRDVRDVMKGIRKRPEKGPQPKKELRLEYLRLLVSKPRPGLRGVRDRALLLFGWWSAMRRSEIVAVNIEHVTFSENGMAVHIPRSKTNQSGARDEYVAIPYASDLRVCPVRAVQKWIAAQGAPSSGPLFTGIRSGERLGDRAVWTIVREYAARCGIEPDLFGAHSLRSGFASEAAKAKKRPDAIKDHLRHASIEMTMRYVRREDIWDENAATGIA